MLTVLLPVWPVSVHHRPRVPQRGAALNSFAGEIYAGGGVRGAGSNRSGVDLGRVAVCVHEDAALLLRRLEPACDAHSKQTFLVVAEDGLDRGP